MQRQGIRRAATPILIEVFRTHGNAVALAAISRSMNFDASSDPDDAKGAVEPSRPEDDAEGNVASFNEQLDHRFQDPLNKSSDSGLPGSGQTPEYSMEEQGKNELHEDTGDPVRPRDLDADAEADTQDQDPGERQRRNQGHQKEDPLAS